MKDLNTFDDYEVGYNIPAKPGMSEDDIQTPCLVLDLDALERNIKKMGDYAAANGMRHRVHGKMHKSVDVAKLQETLGGACGVCCQKVSEPRCSHVAVFAMFWCQTKCVIPLKLIALPVSPHTARVRYAVWMM